MNWKLYITAFVSLLLTGLPQNIFGCGPDEDPHDYFTSFFSRQGAGVKEYEPFYYTALLDFYDDYWMNEEKPDYEKDPVLQEWKKYTNQNISTKEVKDFIYNVPQESMEQMIQFLTAAKPYRLADSIQRNGMTKHFLSQKNLAALRYLSFAKEIEKFTWAPDWETTVKRDSLVLNKYIARAEKLRSDEKEFFLKDKYAYQLCKLAFYNNRFADCIRWHDAYFKNDNTAAVYPLAVSYKAGSFFRMGKKKEAAYEFSKAFTISHGNKKKNFLGFLWATDFCNEGLENDFTAFAKTKEEKAAMLGMFGLYGTSYKLPLLKRLYEVDATSPILPLLAIREVNKVEEQYLTPQLHNEKGGKAFYISWLEEDSTKRKPDLSSLIQFFSEVSENKAAANQALFATAASYVSFINKDYSKAKTLIAKAKSLQPSNAVKEQIQLISLMVMANEKPLLNKEAEQELLSSLQWLSEKASKDSEYKTFLRNFFSQIIAQKYQQQKDDYKAALAYSAADLAFLKEGNEYYSTDNGIQFVRNELSTEQLLKLHDLQMSRQRTAYENYLLKLSSFNADQVIDVIGTSYLRDHNFEKAIEWLEKVSKPTLLTTTNYNYTTNKETIINIDPFYDYLNDWQRYSKSVAKPFNKLTAVQALAAMQKKADTMQNAEVKSKTYYQLASAFYNMSYYGNSWSLLSYERSSIEWNTGIYRAPWEREYYGVYKAKDYYQKAYALTKNNEFKAACYFMMAKCTQRQIAAPAYEYNNWEKYEKDRDDFQKKFKNNPLFVDFVKQFGQTKFYNYTYTRCSYLRDFVKSSGKK